ncbi:hypothetical protein WME90_46335 [Sorangium sp. So ce375]|uniref:hypothetical protein n=1 Tax=Sorangium sp. So ce375 TaxID=3133306 RepID=UPI003F5B38BE
MKASPEPTTWIGLGFITVAALAAYNLGRTSAPSDNRTQTRQDVRKNKPDLRSTLSATQQRLAICEETRQRRHHDLHEGARKPYIREDNATPSPERELSKQCIVAIQAQDINITGNHCRNFRRHFDAYKAILGSSTVGCETVLSIRDLARRQRQICSLITRINEEPGTQDATSDPLAVGAVEDAYTVVSKYGNIDLDKLVKNPACIVRMQAK